MSAKVTVSFYDEKDLFDLLTKKQMTQHRKDTNKMHMEIIKTLGKRVMELEETKKSLELPMEYEYR